MLPREGGHPPVGMAQHGIVGPDVGGEGLGGQDQQRLQGVLMLADRPGGLVEEDGILLLLGHRREFVVRVDVRLEDCDIERFVRLVIAPPDPQRAGDRQCNGYRQGNDGRGPGLRVPPAPGAVGQGGHQAEERQVDRPDPERAAERTGELVPLHQRKRAGESVAKDQPGPGYLGGIEVILLPGDPGGGQKDVGEDVAFEAFFDPSEQAEDQGHLQGVGQRGEDAAADGGVADPEGRGKVPDQEEGVVEKPEAAFLLQRGQPFGREQRNKCEEHHPSAAGHQKGHRGEEGPDGKQDGVFPILFHPDTKI